MVYPVKVQVRYSTVTVIVLVLMGSVFYEVTRTESYGRQSAARTQDIALPAPQPVVHTIRARTDYIGNSSVRSNNIQPRQPDQELLATAGYGSAPVVANASVRTDTSGHGFDAFGSSIAEARAHSSGGSGYSAGGYGMNGVGAWGGVSGVVHPGNAALATPKEVRKAAKAVAKSAKAAAKSGGGGATSGSAGTPGAPGTLTPQLTDGFSTGAAAVEAGGVVAVQTPGVAGSTPHGPAPASTPEPMSLMLVGTGLVALVGARRHLQ
jgi:hypothetical protein